MPDSDVPVALSDGYSITSLGIILASANEVPAGRTMYRRWRWSVEVARWTSPAPKVRTVHDGEPFPCKPLLGVSRCSGTCLAALVAVPSTIDAATSPLANASPVATNMATRNPVTKDASMACMTAARAVVSASGGT
jgi:hypothetical protein